MYNKKVYSVLPLAVSSWSSMCAPKWSRSFALYLYTLMFVFRLLGFVLPTGGKTLRIAS